jgi:hypothetical protein
VDGEAEDRAALEAGLELLEALGYGERFRLLQGDADELIGSLRGELEYPVAIVRADVVPRLQRWFTPTTGDGWQHEPARSGAIGDASVGVEWSYQGKHDKDRVFNGVRATGAQVVVRGFTLVGAEDGALRLRRYIDWAGLFGQLGLSVNWRIPVATLDEDGVPLAPFAGGGIER